MGIENETIVLRLNAAWQPLGRATVKDAMIAMNSGSGTIAAVGIDIDYNLNPDGSYNFDIPSFMNPLPWGEWVKLPIRDFDFSIRTPKLLIRVPTVIIAVNYSKMPKKMPKATSKAIWERDNATCQYTGQRLTKATGNIDHVIPRDRGGKDTFENQVLCHKDINSKKGNRLNEEVGLKLIRPARAPLPIPVSALIREAKHRDWKHFILEKN